MIHVIATTTVLPDQRDEFRRMMPETHAEDDCLAYQPLSDAPPGVHKAQRPPRPVVVTISERWRDLAALRAQLVAPHMAAYRSRVKDPVASAHLQILAQPA